MWTQNKFVEKAQNNTESFKACYIIKGYSTKPISLNVALLRLVTYFFFYSFLKSILQT